MKSLDEKWLLLFHDYLILLTWISLQLGPILHVFCLEPGISSNQDSFWLKFKVLVPQDNEASTKWSSLKKLKLFHFHPKTNPPKLLPEIAILCVYGNLIQDQYHWL